MGLALMLTACSLTGSNKTETQTNVPTNNATTAGTSTPTNEPGAAAVADTRTDAEILEQEGSLPVTVGLDTDAAVDLAGLSLEERMEMGLVTEQELSAMPDAPLAAAAESALAAERANDPAFLEIEDNPNPVVAADNSLAGEGAPGITEPETNTAPEIIDPATLGKRTYTLVVEQSSLGWEGEKVLGSSHTGKLKFTSGMIKMDGVKLLDAEFEVDMTSMTGDGSGVVTHLRGEDFFEVEKYEDAELELTSVDTANYPSYTVTADLTMKGKTHPVTFTVFLGTEPGDADVLQVNGRVRFDRTKWGINYGSETLVDQAKDSAIKDMVSFDVFAKMEVK